MTKHSAHPKINAESLEKTLFNFNYALLPKLMKGEIRIKA